MKFKKICVLTFAISATGILLVGCSSRGSKPTVPHGSVGASHRIENGTVVSVQTVRIEGNSSYVGHRTGTLLGAGVGQTIGSGTGRAAASLGGAAVGGLVGLVAEEAVTKKDGQEITIELDRGRLIAIVQEKVEPTFRPGDRVTVLETPSGYSMVRHGSTEM